MSEPIHQEIDLTASPQRIYEALNGFEAIHLFFRRTSCRDRAASWGCIQVLRWTNHRTDNRARAQSEDLQAWHVAMWPEGVYSIVKFELEKRSSGTRLILDHAGFAAEHREHLDAGWPRMYWEPLKKYLG